MTTLVALAIALHGLLAHHPAQLPGVASWYDWHARQAAAGPALRKALGPSWRGKVVRVCAVSAGQRTNRCTAVRLTDWCQCFRGTARERVIDLDRRAFAVLAPPSRGLVRVVVVLP